MEMLGSLRGDKHEFCLTVIKFKHVLTNAALTNAVCLYNASFLPLISANAFYFHALSLFIDT